MATTSDTAEIMKELEKICIDSVESILMGRASFAKRGLFAGWMRIKSTKEFCHYLNGPVDISYFGYSRGICAEVSKRFECGLPPKHSHSEIYNTRIIRYNTPKGDIVINLRNTSEARSLYTRVDGAYKKEMLKN